MGNRNYSLNKLGKKQGHVQVDSGMDLDGHLVLAVRLHDTIVFQANLDRRFLCFNTGGFYTASTRDVINRALSELRPDMRVFKSAGIWRVSFANGEEESALEACEGKLYGF